MTKPWYPQPRDLLTRPRARMLSLEAVGALLIAWSLSDDDGTIQPDADATARELLVFAVAQHPATPGLERLAVEVVDLAADVLLGVAQLVDRETKPATKEAA